MAAQHKTTRQIIRSFEAKAMKKRPWAVRIADREFTKTLQKIVSVMQTPLPATTVSVGTRKAK